MSNWQADLEMAVRFIVARTADGDPLWHGVQVQVPDRSFAHWYSIDRSPRLFKQDRLALRGEWRMFRDYPKLWYRNQENLFTLKVASLLAQRYPDRGLIVTPMSYLKSRPELEPFSSARSPVAARRKHNKLKRGRYQ